MGDKGDSHGRLVVVCGSIDWPTGLGLLFTDCPVSREGGWLSAFFHTARLLFACSVGLVGSSRKEAVVDTIRRQ